MQNEKLKKFTDFFVKYRRYFCAAVLFVILVVILVKCTGPQKDQKETQNGTQGVTQTTEYQEIGKLQKDADAELVTLMENYYAAYAGGDTDSLEMIAQPLSSRQFKKNRFLIGKDIPFCRITRYQGEMRHGISDAAILHKLSNAISFCI